VLTSPAALAAPRAARGWNVPQALELAKEGVEAKKRGDLALCVQKDQASLSLEDHPYVQLHISSCLVGLGQLKRALVAARDALSAGLRNEDDELIRAARVRVEEILPRIARLKLEVPDRTAGLKITLNGAPLRPAQIKDKITLDPGDYVVEAIREEQGERWHFRERFTLGEGEEKELEVLPKQDHLREDEEQCLRGARTYKERLRCIEEQEVRPSVRLGLEMSGYTDSTAVHVLTPAIRGAVVSPTGGWNVGGSYLLDMVTAASPDLVSSASRPFVEQRHAGSLSGGYRLPIAQVSAFGNVSSEPDYLSRTVGGAVSKELADKLVTPRLGYSYSWDTIGYRNTPFDQYSRALVTHAPEAGVTFVLSPSTILVAGVTAIFERGENAKLYRFVPMFAEDVAAKVQPGQPVADVNAARLAVRPRELVPGQRDRIAVGVRLNHRFAAGGTLRIEERVYTDNWGIKATTTDGRYMHDLGERLRVWPHLRFHAQTGASFYQLAYAARVDQAGTPVEIPRYRTGDREASPFIAVTGGGGARIGLTRENVTPSYAILVSGDVMLNRYFQSLYITNRTAVWGTIAFEAEL
jgi:hypothetical protein